MSNQTSSSSSSSSSRSSKRSKRQKKSDDDDDDEEDDDEEEEEKKEDDEIISEEDDDDEEKIYRGVRKRKKGSWIALLTVNGDTLHLGKFNSQIEAAKAYDFVAKDQQDKKLNFPEDYPAYGFENGKSKTPKK